ncbi:MAG: hypothetical protein ACI865_000422 [Flavobacteriaceae bacterium]|jgi:hypothetical protein
MKEITNKILACLFLLLATPIIAGIYGVIHDQITYTICPEYFTNFKFIQFSTPHELSNSPRLAVALVGFKATWWVGIPIGLLLCPLGIIKLTSFDFFKLKVKSIARVFAVTFAVGLIGYLIGQISLETMSLQPIMTGINASHSELALALTQVKDLRGFSLVGQIHIYSYIGGVAGLIVALFYQMRQTKFLRKEMKQFFDLIKEDAAE